MLSRPPTKLSLTNDDIALYEQRKLARAELRKHQQKAERQRSEGQRDEGQRGDTGLDSSQNSEQSTVENGSSVGAREEELTPAAQTRAARVRMSREQRIGVGGSRG